MQTANAEKASVYDPAKPFNQQVREQITSTHSQEGPIRVKPFGKRFIIEKDARLSQFSELQGTDGIGTKGLLHWKMDTLEYGVQDAFAMVVDDLIESGHKPVLIQDHIQIQEEDPAKILRVVGKLVTLCKENAWEQEGGVLRPIAVTGGETAIINTLQGFELGVTGTGYTRKGTEIVPKLKIGDRLIGLKSSGIHSNGLSFFREEFFNKQQLSLDYTLPWGVTIGQELTIPTRVYLGAVKELLRQGEENNSTVVHGMVHITGGGLSKLRELLPTDDSLNIMVKHGEMVMPQKIFTYSQEKFGVTSEDMYMRFNNGIGYVIAVDGGYVETALALLRKHMDADVIGTVRKGKGAVIIRSVYDDREIAIMAKGKKFFRI